MITFKMGDRFLTGTRTQPSMDSYIEKIYIEEYKFKLPEIAKRIIKEVDECEVIEGSILKHIPTGNYLNFRDLSTSCRTLIGIAMTTNNTSLGNKFYFSSAYCGPALWENWIPILAPISSAKILIEKLDFPYPNNVAFLNNVFSESLKRTYKTASEICQDYSDYEITYGKEIKRIERIVTGKSKVEFKYKSSHFILDNNICIVNSEGSLGKSLSMKNIFEFDNRFEIYDNSLKIKDIKGNEICLKYINNIGELIISLESLDLSEKSIWIVDEDSLERREEFDKYLRNFKGNEKFKIAIKSNLHLVIIGRSTLTDRFASLSVNVYKFEKINSYYTIRPYTEPTPIPFNL